MKKTVIILFLLYCTHGLAQNLKTVQSELKEVTVYLQGAQVTRTFNCEVLRGKTKVMVKDLPARLKEQSIQVASLTKDVRVIAVNTQLNYLDEQKKSEEIKHLENLLKNQNDLIQRAQSILQVYEEEASLIKQNKSIAGQQDGLKVEDLKLISAFFRERLTEIALKKLELEESIEDHNKLIFQYQQQLQVLNNKRSSPNRTVEILIEGKQFSKAEFDLSYTVEEAGWMPSYNVRVDNIDQPVKIIYKAGIFQNTGEDWQNIQLTFSNADPSVSAQAPILDPWFLGFNNYYSPSISFTNDRITGRVIDSDGNPLPAVNIVIQGTSVGTVTNLDGFYELPLTTGASKLIYSFIGYETITMPINSRNVINLTMREDATQLSEVVVMGYGSSQRRSKKAEFAPEMVEDEMLIQDVAATSVTNTTTFEFKVKEPYSVMSGGKQEIIDLVEYDLPGSYTYYAVPKLNERAFLKTSITDWGSYNFLSGEASLFFEGKYIGKTVLDAQNPTDTLTLYLGADRSININREKLKDYTSNSFIGGNRKEVLSFKTEIKNNKAVPVELVLEDQLPISKNENIEVSLLETSKGNFEKDTGKLKWVIKLAPGEHREITFRYEVKYPKDRHLALE